MNKNEEWITRIVQEVLAVLQEKSPAKPETYRSMIIVCEPLAKEQWTQVKEWAKQLQSVRWTSISSIAADHQSTDLESLTPEEWAQISESLDEIVLVGINSIQISELALGCPREEELKWVFQWLSEEKKITALPSEQAYPKQKNIKNLIDNYRKTLTSWGVNWLDWVLLNQAKSPTFSGAEVHLKKRVITAVDIENAAQKGMMSIQLGERDIVTSLAEEVAKEKGINFLMPPKKGES